MSSPPSSQEVVIKLLLLGNAGAGKTSLTGRYAKKTFGLEYLATVGADLTTVHGKRVQGKEVRVDVWDTAGQERFRHLTSNFFRGANGVALVYDITDQKSFQSMWEWFRCIENEVEDEVAVVMVGNKVDVASSRQVDQMRGKILADEAKAAFFETSALTGQNVDAAFDYLVQEAGKLMIKKGRFKTPSAGLHLDRKDSGKTGSKSGGGGCCS